MQSQGIPSGTSIDLDDSQPSQSTIFTSTIDEIQNPKTSSSPLKNEGTQLAQNVSRPTTTEGLPSSKTTITPTKYYGPYPSNNISTNRGIDGTQSSPNLSKLPETVPIQPSTTPKELPVGEYEVSIPNLNFNLDTSNASCDDIQYVCAGINAGNVNFDRNVTSNRELVGCERFTKCVGRLTFCYWIFDYVYSFPKCPECINNKVTFVGHLIPHCIPTMCVALY